MSRISRKHLLAGLAAAGVLGVGIAAPTVAFAEGGSTPSAGASADRDGNAHAQHRTEITEALATELGVPTEKLIAALEKVRAEHEPADRPSEAHQQARMEDRLAQAVKDGKLTQEQADAITKAFEAGVLPGSGMRGHDGSGMRGHDGSGMRSHDGPVDAPSN